MTPVIVPVDVDRRRGARRLAVTVIVLNAWLLVAYALTGPLPYYWRDLSHVDQVNGWLIFGPALLIFMPGFWTAVFAPILAAALAVAAGSALAGLRSSVSRAIRCWLVALLVLDVAYLVFSVTPAGLAIQTWVLD